MKSALIILITSGLASALANGPAPTPAPAKRQFGGGFGGGISNQELVNLAQQLGINLGSDNVSNLSIGQLNCDILQLLALMGLGGSVDVVGLGLNFNQQIAMIAALEQLAQIQNLGLITQDDIASLLSGSIINNIGSVTFGVNGLVNGNFNFGVFKRGLEQLKKEKRIPETLPTPTRALRARGHGRKRQEECTIFDGTTTETTSFSDQTEEATTTQEEDSATTTTDSEESSATEETTTTAEDDAESTSTEESNSSTTEDASSTTEEASSTTEEAAKATDENNDD